MDIRRTKLRISRVLLGGKKTHIVKQQSAEVPIASNSMVGSSEVWRELKLIIPIPLVQMVLGADKIIKLFISYLLVSGII